MARTKGTVDDALANISQGYFDIFDPLNRPQGWEPTDEEMAAALIADPRPDPIAPNPEVMSAEEYVTAKREWKRRNKLIAKIKLQIKGWFAYRYLKDNNSVDRHSRNASSPYANVALQLSGTPLKKPRLLSAKSIWRRDHRLEIDTAARTQCRAENKSPKNALAPIREQIATNKFNNLSQEEKDKFSHQAQEEHAVAMEKWTQCHENPLGTDPASRQKCISNVTAVVQPLLDTIAEATGWKVTLLAGGPCPAEGGRMSMISLHSGKTSGEVPMTFGRFEYMKYRTQLVPMFTNFLRNCWSPEQCREQALDPDSEDFEGMLGIFGDSEDGGPIFTMLDSDPNAAAPQSSPPPSPPPQLRGFSPESPPSVGQRGSSERPPPRSSPDSIRAPSPEPSPRSPPRSPSPIPPTPTIMAPPAPPPTPPQVSPSPSLSIPAAVAPLTSTATPQTPIATPVVRSTRKRPGKPLQVDPGRHKSARLNAVAPTTVLEAAAPMETATVPRGKKGKGSAVLARKTVAKAADLTWFVDAMRLFTEGANGLGSDKTGTLGDEWVALVGAWSSFQQTVKDLSEDSKLPTKNRPFTIKEWIGRARSFSYRPNNVDLTEYEPCFKLWWASMQPSWRIVNGLVQPLLVDGDWSCLRLPGVNGLLSVVAALYYWGVAAYGNKRRTSAWHVALKDCTVAFKQLHAHELTRI